jgi:hypothetical protein
MGKGGANMSDKGWKKFERRIAGKLGGRRVRAGERELEDIEHPILSVEAKLFKSVPVCMEGPMEQAERNAPKGKIPMVCMKKNGRLDDNALVFMRFKDFKRLMAPIVGKIDD